MIEAICFLVFLLALPFLFTDVLIWRAECRARRGRNRAL